MSSPPRPAVAELVGRALADPEWDRFVEAAPGGTYQQTSMWARVKAEAGWRPARITVRSHGEIVAGCQLLTRRVARVGAVGYAPYGPLTASPVTASTDPGTPEAVLDAVRWLVRHDRLLYFKLQPPPDTGDMDCALRARGFVPASLNPAPRMTVRVDLRRPPEVILAGMRSRTRTYIRQAPRRGVIVRTGGEADLPGFLELIEATCRRKGLRPYPLGYYQAIWRSFPGRTHLLLAEHRGEVLAGTLLLAFGGTVSYKMGGWSGEHREVRPNELLHWTGMQWARDLGCRYYDLEGIDPAVGEAILGGCDHRTLDMPGIVHFKLGLGGEVTRFPGCYDYAGPPLLRVALPWVAPRAERLTPIAHRLVGRRRPRPPQQPVPEPVRG